jgi:hypothetical protein
VQSIFEILKKYIGRPKVSVLNNVNKPKRFKAVLDTR